METETEDELVIEGLERVAKGPEPTAAVPSSATPTANAGRAKPAAESLRPSPSVTRRFLITVLFVDVVDSTRRAVELGDSEWLALQEEHEAMVRREVQRFAGRCLSTLGDGLVASFTSAAAGVRCAASIAETSRALGIEIRAGLHSGECERRGSRLGGIVFHVGARLVNLAAVGEVLVSRTVTELVAGGGFVFGRRGKHRLKGLPGEWPLYAFVSRRASSDRPFLQVTVHVPPRV
ncbi:MAG TPA: adenylate/guanylate cyclase domain-containing protein [Candidatus Eisenbacteria bacterium]|nr:adenylate/guanylate cyclase domain-containing protein [Candidatus Eisenbacteria bacterium]